MVKRFKKIFTGLLLSSLAVFIGCDEKEEAGVRREPPVTPKNSASQNNSFKPPDRNLPPEEFHNAVVKQLNDAREKEGMKHAESAKGGVEGLPPVKTPGLHGITIQDGVLIPQDKKAAQKVREGFRMGKAESADSGGEKTIVLPDESGAPRRTFFEHLMGKNKEFDLQSLIVKKGQTAIVTDGSLSKKDWDKDKAAAAENRDTLAHGLQMQMAQKRLNAQPGKSAASSQSEPKKAEVVDPSLAGMAEAAGAGGVAAAPGAGAQPADNANRAGAESGNPPQNEDELKEALEKQYQAALTSPDQAARKAAFDRAAAEKRADAIPSLISEIKRNGVWAEYAAFCLGIIGRKEPEAEAVLLAGLIHKEWRLRRACADSAGRLKLHTALRPLLLALPAEKNYQCRCAYAWALGLLGDGTAVPALKTMLLSADENDAVRAQAAIALACLGDSSGRAHLARLIDSHQPVVQVSALRGMVALQDLDAAGYLSSALESNYEEVWGCAAWLFCCLSPEMVLPVLRGRFENSSEAVRRRAALAMGFAGSEEKLGYIDLALRDGQVQERVLACEVLSYLGRKDRAPELIECLRDPDTSVRQSAAIALTRLGATEALPAMLEVVRGPLKTQKLPPALRGGAADISETLVLLACIRILRGEEGDLAIHSLPDPHSNNWPEMEHLLAGRQKDLLKLYQVVDVMASKGQAAGAVLRQPNGKEALYRVGETVAAGFRVRDLGLAGDKAPAYVKLMRGNESVILREGQSPEVEEKK